MVDQAAGRVPVYFGIGAISTKKSCRLAKMAVKNGAAAVSVLQPMFLKPTYDELYNHFKTIAESVPETPMLLYNNPGRVGYTLSAKLVEELAHNVPNIIGMKDTSGDITQTSEFIRRTRDVGFKVFGGKDTLLYASMCHGAVGGVFCAACGHDSPGGAVLTQEALTTLKALDYIPLHRLGWVYVSQEGRRSLEQYLELQLQQILSWPLKSRDFLRQMEGQF